MSGAYTKALDWHAASTMNGRAYDIGAADGSNVALVHGPEHGGSKSFASHASLIAAAPVVLSALKEGRRAIGDHSAPGDCYATGPLTGDPYRDLVQCPACSFIAMYDAAIAKAEARP